ncbi:hypothetical protein TWF694_005037 [Orbilia ellipsospora]|uniref:Fucose-specific lectin n=1 Tax=Orbilia ellipsospora TaxID=2528407 RepID=A0AAV9WWY1_9PEZI
MSTIINNQYADTTLTGIAAILNPLGENQILEFYTSSYRNLGMITEKASALAEEPFTLQKYQPPPSPGGWELGPLLPGTPLVVLKYNNQIRVYAISKYSKTGGNIILSVSPSTAALDIATCIDAFTGTGDGKNQAWLYELEDKPIGRTVKEYPLMGDGSKVGKPKDVVLDGIGSGSRISAFYHNNSGVRYIVYQASDNKTLRWKPLSSKPGQANLLAGSFGGTTAPANNTLEDWTTHAGCAIEDTAFIFYVGSQELKINSVRQQVSKLYLIRSEFKYPSQDAPEDLNVTCLPNGALSVVPIVNAEGTYDIVVFFMGEGDGGSRLLSKTVYPTGISSAGKA